MNIPDVISKLQSKGVSTSCSVCNGQKQLSEEPVQILVGEGGDLSRAFTGYAMFCNNCGHLDLFSKQHLG